VLLEHPYADAAAMLRHADGNGETALMIAAYYGHADMVRVLLEHPSVDAAAMLRHADGDGRTALMNAASSGHVDVVRVLLEHPCADAAAMLRHADGNGQTALMNAALGGRAPLLLVMVEAFLADVVSDDDDATDILTTICNGARYTEMFAEPWPGEPWPDAAARDEFIARLLERGASVIVNAACQPVVSRVIRERMLMASVPRLINEAVVDLATSLQQQQQQQQQRQYSDL